MIMVMYFVEQIEDEHSKFGFSNVPRIYKKRVREQLILHGNEELAIEGVVNYVGPRPKIDIMDVMKKAEEEYLAKQKEEAEKKAAEEQGVPQH